MNLGKYLLLVLGGDAGVAAIAGSRIYSEVLPQKPKVPAVVFDVVSGDDDYDLDGASGVRTRRVQVDSWAKTRADATRLALAVRAVIGGHSGAAAGFECQGAFLEVETWEFDSESKLWRTSNDFTVTTSGEES